MTASDDIASIEAAFGIDLPEAYRAFLRTHEEDFLERPLEFSIGENPRGDKAWVNGLHTAAQIVEHEERDASCDAESQMLIIGYNVFGGYLYLCYEPSHFGQIYFREPYASGNYHRVAKSFDEFLSTSWPAADEAG